jgi:hypothetical protein
MPYFGTKLDSSIPIGKDAPIDLFHKDQQTTMFMGGSMRKRKTPAGFLAVLGAAIMAMAVLVPAATAATPNPGYTQFAGCPSKEENAAVSGCLVSKIKSGNFKMGSKNVPIEKPFTLSGGYTEAGAFSFNSKGGLQKVKQKVPGGVIGLTGLTWLAEFLGIEALTLYATTELAGNPQPLAEPAYLPIKVHLENSTGVLGPNCYVGSTASPITLLLTTGTTSPPPPNTPITGKEPEYMFDGATEILHLNNGTFVDNSFSAPGASGCVLTLFGFIPISINGLVNTQSGLPSPAGNNETKQNFDLELVSRTKVYP